MEASLTKSGPNDELVPPKPAGELLRQRSLGLPESLWERIGHLAQTKGYRTSEYLRALIERAVAREEAELGKRR